MPFGGKTYKRGRDGQRLTRQLDRVFNLMADGQWRPPPCTPSLIPIAHSLKFLILPKSSSCENPKVYPPSFTLRPV